MDVRLRELLAANLEDGLNQYVVGCLGNMNAVKAYQEQAKSTVWPETAAGTAAGAPASADAGKEEQEDQEERSPQRPPRFSATAPDGDKDLDC